MTAAAPELLEACSLALRWIGEQFGVPRLEIQPTILAAIAQAKGEDAQP